MWTKDFFIKLLACLTQKEKLYEVVLLLLRGLFELWKLVE